MALQQFLLNIQFLSPKMPHRHRLHIPFLNYSYPKACFSHKITMPTSVSVGVHSFCALRNKRNRKLWCSYTNPQRANERYGIIFSSLWPLTSLPPTQQQLTANQGRSPCWEKMGRGSKNPSLAEHSEQMNTGDITENQIWNPLPLWQHLALLSHYARLKKCLWQHS